MGGGAGGVLLQGVAKRKDKRKDYKKNIMDKKGREVLKEET